MNTFMLAFKELEREGRKPSDKNYGMLWERRVYKINNYLMKIQGNEARRK
jgi:hypothetical protein